MRAEVRRKSKVARFCADDVEMKDRLWRREEKLLRV